MTMRQKMARAMYEAMRERIPSGIGPLHAWEHQSDGLHDDWLAATDAGLGTLMEPTEEMIEAAWPALDLPPDYPGSVTNILTAFIRAAKEGH